MPETIPPEHVGKPGYDTVLNHRVVTIGDILRAAGYRTYLTGKWHLGSDATRLPVARGYDRAFSPAHPGAANFDHRPIRKEERRGGKEGVRTCNLALSPVHSKN